MQKTKSKVIVGTPKPKEVDLPGFIQVIQTAEWPHVLKKGNSFTFFLDCQGTGLEQGSYMVKATQKQLSKAVEEAGIGERVTIVTKK